MALHLYYDLDYLPFYVENLKRKFASLSVIASLTKLTLPVIYSVVKVWAQGYHPVRQVEGKNKTTQNSAMFELQVSEFQTKNMEIN